MNRPFTNFKPDFIAPNIEAIKPELFEDGMPLSGVGALAYDVDGTLTSYHATTVEHEVYLALKAQAEIGLKLYVISNAYGDKRLRELHDMYEMNGLGMKIFTPEDVAGRALAKRNRKPKPYMLNIVQAETDGLVAMVGDQLSKDVLSATRAGALSVQVPRRGEGDDWRVRTFQRPFELGVRAIHGMPIRSTSYGQELRAV